MPVFEKTYRLMSMAVSVVIPLFMAALVIAAFVAVGCLEPTMDVQCRRDASQTATCTIDEHTWISRQGPTTVDLAATRFEIEYRGKQRILFIRNEATGAIAFPTALTSGPAIAVKRKIDAYSADSSIATLSVREGIKPVSILALLPVVLLFALFVSLAFGGRLVVRAGPGWLSATRVRLRVVKTEQRLTFPPGELPMIECQRFDGYRQRNQGALVVRASTGAITLARMVPVDRLEPIQQDLTAHFASGAPFR